MTAKIALPTRMLELLGPEHMLRVNEADSVTPMVVIGYDGTITYGPNYTPDAAAQQFWTAVANAFPGAV